MGGENSEAPIVIVGGGQAAASLVVKLRSLGDERAVVLLSDEPVAPYQRPNLSKKYLRGELTIEDLMVRPQTWYAEREVDLRLGLRAEQIDRSTKSLSLSDGSRLTYSKLVLATGGEPRRLPAAIGGDLSGVYTLRDVADADRLAPLFTAGRRLLVVGGGYIGLEAAAVAAQAGLEVTVIEMAERILQRVAARETSDYIRALHQRHGVRILEETQLVRILGEDGTARRAEFSSGDIIDLDFVTVGTGIAPRTELAEEAGLAIDSGIAVNGACLTSDPDILAIGDCTSFLWQGHRTRLESVQNAMDQGEAAACSLAGQEVDYNPVPWFWSDQFDMKLQIAGLNRGFDHSVTRPGTREGSQSIWYYRGDTLLAVDAMNDAKSFMAAKKLLQKGISPAPAYAADPASNLKALLKD